MEKGWKRLILVAGCLLFGCLLGYFVTVTQAREQDDPAYLAFFEERGLASPGTGRAWEQHHRCGAASGRGPHGADALSVYCRPVEDPCGTETPDRDRRVSYLYSARCAWGSPVPHWSNSPAISQKVSAGADRPVKIEPLSHCRLRVKQTGGFIL